MNLINFHNIAYKLYQYRVPFIQKIIYYIQFIIFNSSVPYNCKIGTGTKFAYGGIGVVIHERAEIGMNCTIGQSITIGGKSKEYNVPKIGNNVYIGAGARIIGNVKIGDNVVIGANSVVTKDIPANCIAVVIPAKIIKTNISINDYV